MAEKQPKVHGKCLGVSKRNSASLLETFSYYCLSGLLQILPTFSQTLIIRFTLSLWAAHPHNRLNFVGIMVCYGFSAVDGRLLGGQKGEKSPNCRRKLARTLIYFVFAAAPTWHFILLGELLIGTVTIAQPAMSALVADSLPPEKRGLGYSLSIACWCNLHPFASCCRNTMPKIWACSRNENGLHNSFHMLAYLRNNASKAEGDGEN